MNQLDTALSGRFQFQQASPELWKMFSRAYVPLFPRFFRASSPGMQRDGSAGDASVAKAPYTSVSDRAARLS
jgi:hypothetical protein